MYLIVGKSERMRPRVGWVDNIKMDFGEIEWSGVDWLRIGTSGARL
jgi:hypothetical protein